MKHVLFYTRLALYLITVLIPFFHPAIIVPYDLLGIGLWLVLVPVMFVAAFYLSPPLLKIRFWLLLTGAALAVASVIFAGFSLDALFMFLTGAVAFIMTVLVFKTQGKGRIIAVFEIFFIGILYLTFLSFSRSSEDIAQASYAVVKLLFVFGVLSFFIHMVVLFLASFPASVSGRGKRNVFIFLALLIPIGLGLAFLLPTDFIMHQVRLNALDEDIEQQSRPLDPDSPFDASQGNRRDRNGRLEGLDADKWGDLNLSKRGSGSYKQYAVMIVATQYDTLYLGGAFYGNLDQEEGLLSSDNEPLNSLSGLRLIETWRNPQTITDAARIDIDAGIYTTLGQRYFAYIPASISPTILTRENRPFVFSYEAEFAVSVATAEMLSQSRTPTREELEAFSEYLAIPFESEDDQAFRSYCDALLSPAMTPLEKLAALMNGFKIYQYELGYSEDVSTKRILQFLLETKTGDCTEFSNTLAILVRYAGIPSRVVTGYLADRDLQLPKHRQGLAYLQKQMEVLQQYSLDELVMVTTAHRHSWTQVWFPDYGWLDLEATATALPPKMGGNANDWNLVVPRMDHGKNVVVEDQPFPWLELLLGFLITIGATVVVLYLIRFIREGFLFALSRRPTVRGLQALQKLLLIRLVNRGHPFKEPSLTIFEFSEKLPPLTLFAEAYTELRYREDLEEEAAARLWDELRSAYKSALKNLPVKGAGFLRVFVSLKGFRY